MSKIALTYYNYLRDQGVPEELAAKTAMDYEVSVEARVERTVGPFRTELRSEMGLMRTELRSEMRELRSEMNSIRSDLRHRLYWLLGIIITSNAAFTYIAKHL